MIEINVNGSVVSVQTTVALYCGSQDVHTCKFIFDTSWESFSKSAVFRVNGKTITVLVDADNSCILPWELLVRGNIGQDIEVGMYGVSADTEVLTSVWDSLGTVREGSELGIDAREPSAGVYEQVMSNVRRVDAKVDNYNAEVQTQVQRAESAASSALGSAESAAESETVAKNFAAAAVNAKTAVETALNHLPAGSTLVINDLTTGGTTAALSAEMGKVLAARPRNLLDNSDFTNPVNQKGQTLYEAVSTYRYTIDRWRTPPYLQLEVLEGSIKFTSTHSSTLLNFAQRLSDESAVHPGDVVTIAGEKMDGTIFVGTVTVPESGYAAGPYIEGKLAATRLYAPTDNTPNGNLSLVVAAGGVTELKWLALYRGEYTAATLPPYQKKGYGAELAECQRYYQIFSSEAARPTALADYRPAMRTTPATGTIDIDGVTYYYADANL